MKFIVIDKDCWDVILIVWSIMLVLVICTGVFIKNRWISVPLILVFIVFAAFVFWFHRIPERDIPEGDGRTVTSVADGKVVIIEKVFEDEYLNTECIQVSVYMNFFDVHANFWPVDGEVAYYKYHPGKNLLAFRPKAADENEHSSTAIATDYGPVFFKQLAGTFARRIVCYSEEGMETQRGEQCGIIKFGSRIDMFLPLGSDIKVEIGDLTRACETVIAELPDSPL